MRAGASGNGGPRGRFLTLEGIEGVGKSTNLALVAELVRAAGHEVLLTREPGGTPFGERVRTILLDGVTGVPAQAELLLMFAARSAHLDDVIRPALERGTWVVCDRFTDASYAYQGGGRGLAETEIQALESLVLKGLKPDLTLLLDAPPAATTGRQDARGGKDRFEQEAESFFQRVRAAYLATAAREPQRVKVVDATRPLAEVQAEIRRLLADYLRAGAAECT